jgi:menaquinone-dependent protoporphyrinogen oxidase
MNVLVTYATRHGATAGIASRIADSLIAAGHDARAVPVEDVTDLDGYQAVVLGSAAYMFHWLKPAVRFARHHHAELAARPVWLFSSGPIGGDQVDAQGQDVRISTRPKEWDELVPLICPRGEAVFFGAYDPTAPPVGLGEKLMRHMPAAAKTLPDGDFRDWDAIENWATEIATALPIGTTP